MVNYDKLLFLNNYFTEFCKKEGLKNNKYPNSNFLYI